VRGGEGSFQIVVPFTAEKVTVNDYLDTLVEIKH
jgi:hypothetical protein